MEAIRQGSGQYLGRRLRLEYTNERELAERTDDNAETFVDSLPSAIQAYGIPNGGALIVVAVPAGDLAGRKVRLDTTHSLTASVRAIVGDSAAGAIVASLDTLRTWHAVQGMPKDVWLSAWFVVPVPVGNWQISVVLGDTAHRVGAGTRFTGVPVARFDGRTLTLGDPILGREGSGLTWQRNGAAIPLNPTSVWRMDEPAILNYEVDGLVPGRSYRTSLELWDASGKPKQPRNRIAFVGAATSGHDVVQREISLQALSPGSYRLVVIVTDEATGQSVIRERRLNVRK
jgi:hypothetical protein